MPSTNPHSDTIEPYATGRGMIELRSEPVQEIISAPPSGLVRWGTTVFFLIIALLLFSSWLIEYPDIVKAPFVLSSTNAPKSVNARQEGKLIRLLVKENAMVTPNQVLAYLESTANHDQVLKLSVQLEQMQHLAGGGQPGGGQSGHDQPVQNQEDSNKIPYLSPVYTELGELQTAYQTFAQAWQNYASFLAGGFYEAKRKLLQKELSDLEQMALNLEKQKQLLAQDYALAENEFAAQQNLLKEKVIAPLEFKREQSRLLSKKMPLEQIHASILGNLSAQTSKQKELLELDKLISEQESIFRQVLNTFRSQVEDWKKKYLLVAPVAGQVHFSTFLQENQTVKAGQELFFIAGEDNHEYGEIRVGQTNFGKIKTGQKVWVRFNSYPSQEFGMVEGRIEFVSQIPGKDSTFLAKVILPKGLLTNYHKKLTYKMGMTASADIITADQRLAEKLLFSFRKAMER